MNKKIKTELAVAIIIFFSVLIAGSFLINKNKEGIQENKQVACTEEAKLCPDGSSVDRVSPDCEFAECQNKKRDLTREKGDREETFLKMIEDFDNWNIYVDKKLGFEMKYPRNDWVEFDGDGFAVRGLFYEGIKEFSENEKKYLISSSERINIIVSSIDNPNDLSLQELENSLYDKCIKEDGGEACFNFRTNFSDFENTTVDGFPAFKSGFIMIDPPIPTYNLYIKIPGKYVLLKGSDETLGILFDKIVSTVKFIK